MSNPDLNRTLNDLRETIANRGRNEAAYIQRLKDRLRAIIQSLTVCARDASVSIQNGTLTAEEERDIIARINAASDALRNLGPLNPGNRVADDLIGRTQTYATQHLKKRPTAANENTIFSQSSWPFSRSTSAAPAPATTAAAPASTSSLWSTLFGKSTEPSTQASTPATTAAAPASTASTQPSTSGLQRQSDRDRFIFAPRDAVTPQTLRDIEQNQRYGQRIGAPRPYQPLSEEKKQSDYFTYLSDQRAAQQRAVEDNKFISEYPAIGGKRKTRRKKNKR